MPHFLTLQSECVAQHCVQLCETSWIYGMVCLVDLHSNPSLQSGVYNFIYNCGVAIFCSENSVWSQPTFPRSFSLSKSKIPDCIVTNINVALGLFTWHEFNRILTWGESKNNLGSNAMKFGMKSCVSCVHRVTNENNDHVHLVLWFMTTDMRSITCDNFLVTSTLSIVHKSLRVYHLFHRRTWIVWCKVMVFNHICGALSSSELCNCGTMRLARSLVMLFLFRHFLVYWPGHIT